MAGMWVGLVIVIILFLVLLAMALKVVAQYERGVILRLGRFVGIREPGLRVIIPFVDRMWKVDTRIVTMDVPAQEVITKDNVTIKVDAVVYLRVVNADSAVLKVADYVRATSLISQTTLRSVLGQSELDEILSHRDELNARLQQIVDEQTDPWGVKITTVEIKDVQLPSGMQRAMAAQAEAERDRRAKVVHADGEFQASEKLAQAAAVLSQQPAALQLRYLGTLKEIATERTSMVVFPIPIDMFSALLGRGSEPKR